ncbi:MAG: PQQ-binding-like beta-propeller repeat protein [Elusimicrobia bacterium]|nr:PQQ-binding-like beta-propeller repeat protein [Elusimicrobiota bacterium]
MKRAHIQNLRRSLLCLSAFILCLAVMGARAAEWQMFQLDSRHSANNAEDFIRLPLENYWQAESGADSFGFSSAIQANNAVYTAFSNGKLSAFNKTTGAQLWSLKVDGIVHSAPLYHNDIVYFATSDGKIYALAASDGKVVWVYAAGTAINTSPVVQDNLIFAASTSGMLYALKIENGELAWKTDLGNDYIRSSPAADQSRVYTATINGDIFALDKLSGVLLWKKNIQSQIGSAPSVDGQTVFVGSYDGKIRALRTQDGAIIWTYDVGSPATMALAISSDAIHAVSRDGQIYALAKSNGSLLWKLKMDAASYSVPAIIGDKLLAGANDKNLYTLMVASGSLVSKTPLAAKVLSPIALSRGKAAFLGDTGGLYLLKSPNQPPLSASDLKVNGKSNPPLNSSAPVFTWHFRDTDPDDKQGAYVLQIADESLNFTAPVFDSGMVFSADAVFTLDRLLPEGKYFWRVRNFDLFEDFGDFTQGDDFFVWERTAPQISISSPIANSVYVATKDRIGIVFAVMDNLDPAPAITALLTQVEDRGSPRGLRPASVAVVNGQAIEPLDIDDGIWRLTVSATDFADNASSAAGGLFKVIHDVLPPVTELTVSGPLYAGGGNIYIRKDKELKLESLDDLVQAGDGIGLGVKRQGIEVRGQGSEVRELAFKNPKPKQGALFISTFTLDKEADGRYSLAYNSEDILGNLEKINISTFIVDNTAPKTGFRVEGIVYRAGENIYHNSGAVLELIGVDVSSNGVASGLKKTNYRWDDGGWLAYILELEISSLGEGRHILAYYSADNLDNTEAVNNYPFIADFTAPQTAFNRTWGPAYLNYVSTWTLFELAAADPGGFASGVKETVCNINDGGDLTSPLKFTLPSAGGNYLVKYRSRDNVENLEVERSSAVFVDGTAPLSALNIVGGRQYPGAGAGSFYASLDTKFRFTANDPVVGGAASGVKAIEYVDNDGLPAVYTQPIALGEGKHSITYRASDRVENTEVFKSTHIYMDGTAPVSVLSLSGDQYKGDRQYVSPRTDIVITAADPIVNEVSVGVKETRYTVDGGAYDNYAVFKLNAEGRRLVSFYSADYVDNVETAKTSELWVDMTAPATELTISGARYSPPGDDLIYITENSGIVLTPADPLSNDTASGVLITKYRINRAGLGGLGLAGDWQVYAGSFTILTEGLYILEYYSLDRVQNAEQLKTANLAVDNTPPVTAISLGEPRFEVFGLPVLTPDTPVTLSAFDPVSGDVASGLNSIYYELEDAHTGVRAPVAAYLESFKLAQGAFIIRYWSKDNTGNVEISKEIRVSVTTWREDGLIAVSGLNMSGTSDIVGTVKSNAVVSVSGNARILGDVTASTITVSGKAQITGQKVSGAAPVHPEPVYMAAITESAKREAEKANSAIPKDYLIDGKLVVTSKAGLTLSTGTYYFKGLEFAGGSSITVAGKVDILVEGGIKISGGSSVNAGGAASNLNIFVSTTSSVDFTGGTDFLACLYAPYSHLKLAGNAVLGGHYFAKTAAVSGTGNFVQSGENLPHVVIVTADSGGKKKVSALGTEASALKGLAGPDPVFRLGEVYVFPNPAKGGAVPTFHIECGIADKVTIKIYTVLGRPAHEHTITGAPAALDDGNGVNYAYEYAWRGHIPSGVYYYYIEAEKAGKNLKKTGKFGVVR